MSRSTEKKAVFFDADGTLCDMEKGVPASTKEALKKLRENGHEAWLCTGRSRAFVSWYLEELPFTGTTMGRPSMSARSPIRGPGPASP